MLIFAGISGFFTVAFGAIGSHALSSIMSVHQMDWIETGLRYQMLHTVALMVLGAVLLRKVVLWFYWSGVFFSVGILLFSGSLGPIAGKILFLFYANRGSMFPDWLAVSSNWRYASKEIGVT